MGVRRIPKGCNFWPQNDAIYSQVDIVKMYESGFAACWEDDEAKEEFVAWSAEQNAGMAYGSDIAHAYGLAESGKGKLVLPFLCAEQVFPGCMPGPAQQRGDCVSHSTKNAALVTLACEIVAGKPDPVTGKVEGKPEISEQGIKQGVLSTEYNYWWRGYNGDGWHCGTSARMACQHGIMLRKPYPELGIDLTNYSGRLAGQYGARKPPETIASVGRQNIVRTATTLRSKEERRDFLANGYAVTSCGGEGFSNRRDENGVSSRQGSWAHAMVIAGFDDRPSIIQRYGDSLELIGNSWGIWNSGSRRILGTDIEIPHGYFWARSRDVSRREAIAVSNIAGWPARQLPHYGATGLI
jgi:hypothetical protein